MLHNGVSSFAYDSANRLVIAADHLYTYNAENVRIRSYNNSGETKYTYNTNSKPSQLLVKTTNNVDTKYVYGRGLIGQETGGVFKTYHFDCRGSTVAVTSESGNVTDTFAYDTYGKQISRTGTSDIIFGYNGRDGVVTDDNGLIYMRARYYSPDMKRFINADVVAGSITNAVTLNRYAYANGNPVSFVDPFGLSAEKEESQGESLPDFHMAIYVVDKTSESGLQVLGHTRLYFIGDDNSLYRTEFTGTNKKSAHVVWIKEDDILEIYATNAKSFHEIKDVEYVVWTGDFNKSAELAKQYYENQNFGKYNVLFNNCSDYTDAILDVAEIDGCFSQNYIDDDSLISVPAIRMWETKWAQRIDSLELFINKIF